jgi:hypothetical protein
MLLEKNTHYSERRLPLDRLLNGHIEVNMARIPDLRLIKKEDFDSKDQKLIDQIAFPINNFMQQVINVLKNGVDFTNLNQQIISFTISVDAFGVPVSPISFKNTLNTKIQGLVCINAVNQTTTSRFPQSTPFISYTLNNNVIIITNIAGLGIPSGQTNSDVYTFTVLTYGTNLPTA